MTTMGSVQGEGARLAFVEYDREMSPADLVAPAAVEDVFTVAERVHCSERRSLDRWAGRLAAKRAVLDCLGIDEPASLADVEVVPGPHEGQQLPHLCAFGHRPVVRLAGAVEEARLDAGVECVALSISHAGGVAVAFAVACVGPRAGRS